MINKLGLIPYTAREAHTYVACWRKASIQNLGTARQHYLMDKLREVVKGHMGLDLAEVRENLHRIQNSVNQVIWDFERSNPDVRFIKAQVVLDGSSLNFSLNLQRADIPLKDLIYLQKFVKL